MTDFLSATPDEIAAVVDQFFPKRKPDNSPDYRPGQRETCLSALKAFQSGKRLVVIDAPTGSGKSVVNYTIAKALFELDTQNRPRAAYLTAQKTLQDQVEDEGWAGVRNIKGRNEYICRFEDLNNTESWCDDRRRKCVDTEKYQYRCDEKSFSQMVGSSSEMIDSIKDPKELRRFTGFTKNIQEEVAGIRQAYVTEFGAVDYSATTRAMGCKLTEVECSVKGARLMAALSDMVVANPDVFYHMRFPEFIFRNCGTIVWDEAHGCDKAIIRIFSMSIPVKLLEETYGVSMLPVYHNTNALNTHELLTKTYLPIFRYYVACLNFLSAFKPLAFVKTIEDLRSSVVDNEACVREMMHEDFKKAPDQKPYEKFSIISLLCSVMTGIPDPMWPGTYSKCRELFCRIMDDCGITDRMACPVPLDDIFGAITRWCHGLTKGSSINLGNKEGRHNAHLSGHYNAFAAKAFERIEVMFEELQRFYGAFEGLLSIDEELPAYVKKSEMVRVNENTYHDTNFYRSGQKLSQGFLVHNDEMMIELTPVKVGALLQRYYFSQGRRIVLSSATWPDAKGSVASFGFKHGEGVVLRIPSRFPPSNRPIYVCPDPDWTDFSQRDGETGYSYQKEPGSRKFCLEIKRVVDHIRFKNGDDCNILIHTFSFGIAQLIAQYYTEANEKMLIHVGKETKNLINGFVFPKMRKQDIINTIMANPKSGYIFVSPSMTEGLDFKGDLCRAQIILKAPIPNLGEPYTYNIFNGNKEIGLASDRKYLDRCLAIDLGQMYGRIVRSDTDYGETYMMDTSITRRLSKAFGIRVHPELMKAPGDMREMNMEYVKQGIVLKDGRFVWIG